jgi:CDP-6-deoxy-D-xylo-4-hexulose-3-dehydrase
VKIPLASAGLRNCDIAAAEAVLRSGNLTMGEKVAEFENKMAEYLGVKYFVMVNSGSSANLIMFEAMLRPSKGLPLLKAGDGVLVPAVAWPTTIWPIIQLGLRPVFVDVNKDTIAIDLELAKSILKKDPGIKAIFPIHPLGFGLDDEELKKFVSEHGLHLLNDVCESLGSWRNEVHSGLCGLAASFSFYFSHHITTMEGGGVATDDLDFANDLRAIRSHGWSRDRFDVEEWNQKSRDNLLTSGISINHSKFQFITTGYNVRPMEIQAAIGIEQLKSLDDFVIRRRNIAKSVKKALEGSAFEVLDCGTLEVAELETSHSWMLICIRINKNLDSDARNQIEHGLERFEIESRPVLTGNFLNQPAVSRLENMPKGSDFPNAELISKNYFMVGAHHDLSNEQVKHLGDSLRSLANYI